MSVMRRYLVVVLCIGASLFCVTTQIVAVNGEPVRTESGLIAGTRGEHESSVRVFRGIPYAASPVGPLRWRAPRPPTRWDSVRPADHFSPVCMQPARTGVAALLGTSQRLGTSSED